MDWLSKIKGALDKVWGSLNGGNSAPAEPLPVTTRPATEEDKRKADIEQGQFVNPQPAAPAATPTPQATPTPYPTAAPGIDNAMNYIIAQMPSASNQTPQEYFPALGNGDFMQSIIDADKIRQGLSSLLLLQSFFESTLGRGSKNYFGTLPGGEGSGVNPQFATPTDAVDYQLGPNVLGGGANPNMNILGESTPIDYGDVQKLYQSYNPSGDYLNTLLSVLFPKNALSQAR